MGMLEHAWAGGGVKVAPETIKPKTPAETAPEAPPESGPPISPEEIKPGVPDEAAAPEVAPQIFPENIIEVQKGDTIWGLAEKQLEAKGYFKGLTGSPEEILAKKRYFIDAIKDKIEENPEKFGIASGDADLIKPGDKIDFSSIFDTKEGQVDLIRYSARAGGLSHEEIESILQSRGQVGRSAEEILQQEKGRSISEMTPEEKKAAIAEIQEKYTEKAPVKPSDESVSKIPDSLYIKPDEAARMAAENAAKYPEFYGKINKILGDFYFRYENYKNFKIGILLGEKGPQWRVIEESFGPIKSESYLEPENLYGFDSGTKTLISKTKEIFNAIPDPLEKETARNLTLDQFLRKYSNKL